MVGLSPFSRFMFVFSYFFFCRIFFQNQNVVLDNLFVFVGDNSTTIKVFALDVCMGILLVCRTRYMSSFYVNIKVYKNIQQTKLYMYKVCFNVPGTVMCSIYFVMKNTVILR